MLPTSLIPQNTNIEFVTKRWWAFAFSVIITILTIVVLFIKGLNFGIDFTGGIVMEIQSDSKVEISEYRDIFAQNNYRGVAIQNFGEQGLMIRLQPQKDLNQSEQIERIKTLLQTHDSNIDFRKVDYVGPRVGDQLVIDGALALFLAIIAMVIYIWFRFSWWYGLGATVALFHDAFIMLGFYSVMGYEFDLTSIAAILTIIGYSINDTVVIYDRIRENCRKYKKTSIALLINKSINETLSRTIMTSGTTLIVCLALVIYGGEVIKGFSTAVFFGIAFGTYSSIYIAAPILLRGNKR